ncbi:sorting nexin-21 isoform X2 [Cylas formicarius]|uniref:sorting nexin-21 isoform X2 n=1 Tax=Cylas formicarius TaxID=197179 RepID=UPI0029585A40|nr:sorting nexin-21 isoform X2 [Cylas formicarius]XP_060517275.1 sorting nexin-21 isoform X2 [Cylas formicarius]
MTQVLTADRQGLVFEIISTRIAEDSDKKYVIYTLQVRFISGTDDPNPSVIDRRYTDFLNLYNSLKRDYPSLMANVTFPKKVLTGNFDSELISQRSTYFESLLKHVCVESKLRTSAPLTIFMQEPELTKAKELLAKCEFDAAQKLLEENFKLLNKVFLDRSPVVLLALCRLVGCSVLIPGMVNAKRWAELALYRYEGVSDSELLELYLPLLNACTKIWWMEGDMKTDLETRLNNLQRRGIKINSDVNLLEAINEVEKKYIN